MSGYTQHQQRFPWLVSFLPVVQGPPERVGLTHKLPLRDLFPVYFFISGFSLVICTHSVNGACIPFSEESFNHYTSRVHIVATMVDNEKDYIRYSIHNSNSTPAPPNASYLPRLNFLNEGVRSVNEGVPNRNSAFNYNYIPPVHTAPGVSQSHSSALNSNNANYTPRQSENLHRHESSGNPAYVSRRQTSTEGTRHNHNGIHGSSYISRHDPATGDIGSGTSQGNTLQGSTTYPPRMKDTCDCCNHHGNRDPGYLPKRTNSSDSISHGIHGPQFLQEDMGEESALRKMKTANSISISPEVSLILSCTNLSMLTHAQLFEKLYLSPQTQVKGDLRKTFANPTPIALIGYIVALVPLSCDLMVGILVVQSWSFCLIFFIGLPRCRWWNSRRSSWCWVVLVLWRSVDVARRNTRIHPWFVHIYM